MFTLVPMDFNAEYVFFETLIQAMMAAEQYDCVCAIKSPNDRIIKVLIGDEWITYH
jgi:hypothetical protein